jgi:hypothetical protein
MKKLNDLLRRLQSLEAVRRLSIERGEILVESADEHAPMDEDRQKELQRLFERKSPERNN